MSWLDPVFACDFYKMHHKFQYPSGSQVIYANFTPRSNRLSKGIDGKPIDKIVWVGLQGFIKWFLIDHFNKYFFNRPIDQIVSKLKRRMGPDYDTTHFEELHSLGYLPIVIKSLPEGSVVDMKIPVMTVYNTLPDQQFAVFWVTNFLETALSNELWPTTTVASIAYEYRKLLERYAAKTGSPKDFVLWQGHDFSYRGVEGLMAAFMNFGHLTSFLGTDTIPAIDYAEEYYDGLNTFVGGSVYATEHSVMCAGGKESEIDTYRRIMSEVHPTGVVSIVSDTWDFWKVVGGPDSIAAQLKDVIMNRQPDAIGLNKVVFRPDSGDPVEILCGIKYTELDSGAELPHWTDLEEILVDFVKIGDTYHEIFWDYDDYGDVQGYSLDKTNHTDYSAKGAVECLWDIFGGTITETGHKLLDCHVGLIYGDSITLDRANKILKNLEAKGFASANVVFGIGSYTYQYNTRDTFGFAMKATWALIDGEDHELFKDPVTDSGVKKSAKGLLRVELEDGKFVLYDQQNEFGEMLGELQPVFINGNLVNETSLEKIREKVNQSLLTELASVVK